MTAYAVQFPAAEMSSKTPRSWLFTFTFTSLMKGALFLRITHEYGLIMRRIYDPNAHAVRDLSLYASTGGLPVPYTVRSSNTSPLKGASGS